MQFEPGAHDCHLYRTWSERSSIVVAFVSEGLARGEHCAVVANVDMFDRWRSELREVAVDVDRDEQSGALAFVSGEAWRASLSGPAPNSIKKARATLAMLDPQLARFAGVRIIGDAEWDRPPAVQPDVLCHWEATANLVFERSNVRVICQYDASQAAPKTLHAALRTHASVIWEARRRRNPSWEAPAILEHEPHLNGSTADHALIETLLAHLGEEM